MEDGEEEERVEEVWCEGAGGWKKEEGKGDVWRSYSLPFLLFS